MDSLKLDRLVHGGFLMGVGLLLGCLSLRTEEALIQVRALATPVLTLIGPLLLVALVLLIAGLVAVTLAMSLACEPVAAADIVYWRHRLTLNTSLRLLVTMGLVVGGCTLVLNVEDGTRRYLEACRHRARAASLPRPSSPGRSRVLV